MTRTSTILDVVDVRLDADVLDRSVSGFGITEPATLRSVLAGSRDNDDITVLVFLRHFG